MGRLYFAQPPDFGGSNGIFDGAFAEEFAAVRLRVYLFTLKTARWRFFCASQQRYSPVADTPHWMRNVAVELAGKTGIVVVLGARICAGVAGHVAPPAGVQLITLQLLKPALAVS